MMKNFNRNSKLQRGSATPMVIVLIGGATMVGLGVVSLSSSGDSMANKSVEKQQATNLAEAGIQVMYDTIKDSMRTSDTFPAALGKTEHMAKRGAKVQLTGTFTARVINSTVKSTVVNWGDGSKADQINYTFKLEGSGETNAGLKSIVQATYYARVFKSRGKYKSVTSTSSAGAGNGVPMDTCPGAIMANTQVSFKTNNGIRTYSPNKDADVVANKGIIWETASGSKAGNSNPNVMDLQGQFQVPGTKEYGYIYDFTVGPSGIGNPSGRKNYRTPFYAATSVNPILPANTVARRSHPRPFPNETLFNQWETEWVKQAKTGGVYPTQDSAAMIGRAGDGWKVIGAPAFIDGDLVVRNGQQIRLMPTSSKTYENIIYVKGDVKNLSELKNLGVTLIVLGQYSDDSDAQYEVETQGSPYSNIQNAMLNANFISLNRTKDAIVFRTNSSADTGLVYAAHGGIQVLGANPEFSGKIVSAGADSNIAGVNIEPNGGASFVVHYKPHCAGARRIIPSAEKVTTTTTVTEISPGTIIGRFDPGRMENWLQVL